MPKPQQTAFEEAYSKTTAESWNFERTLDPVTRYLRDRRVNLAIQRLMKLTGSTPSQWTALALCAGPGGEGTLLANLGLREVTVSDFSETALSLCKKLDPRLKTVVADAEQIGLPSDAYDLVIVQDGLHHLPRPTLGLTEMIRVAKHAVIVIEPHEGIVSRLIGTVWEITGAELNYVFRWNKWLFAQVIRSYLLLGQNLMPNDAAQVNPLFPYRSNLRDCSACSYQIDVSRVWDHHVTMRRLSKALGGGKVSLIAVKAAYALCSIVLPRLGNMFIGIIVKSNPTRS